MQANLQKSLLLQTQFKHNGTFKLFQSTSKLVKCKIQMGFYRYTTFTYAFSQTPLLYKTLMIKDTKFTQSLTSIPEKDQEKNTQSQQQEEQKNYSQSLVPLQSSKIKQLGLKKKEKNFLKRILRLSPTLEQTHIFKLFGFLGINQKAIQNPDYSQSLIYSFFAYRVIQKVEIYNYAIVIYMSEPTIPQYQPPVEYLIEKFKSKGDSKFYQLSNAIVQVLQMFKQPPKKPPVQQKLDSITKYFDSMGDQMYISVLSSRKFAISKALLTYLEYDVEQFTVEAIKFRTTFIELFSAISYGTIVKNFLNCFKYIVKLSRSEISFAEFKQLTTYTYNCYIQSKSHVRSYCNMTNYPVSSNINCLKVNFIYFKQGEVNVKKYNDPKITMAIQEEKERIKQAQYTTLNKIKAVPKHLIKHNQKLFASYKERTKDEQEAEKQITDQ